MPTSSPVFGWPIPVHADVADGPGGFSDLALAIEETINNPSVVTYTPSWTADGTIQPVNPSSRVGYYQIQRKICQFYARIGFGASVGGGNGPLRVGLPFPGKTGLTQISVNAWLYVPGNANFYGFGEIRAGEQTVLVQLPLGQSNTSMGYWRSEFPGGGITTTLPSSPDGGVRSVTNGGSIIINGSYLVN